MSNDLRHVVYSLVKQLHPTYEDTCNLLILADCIEEIGQNHHSEHFANYLRATDKINPRKIYDLCVQFGPPYLRKQLQKGFRKYIKSRKTPLHSSSNIRKTMRTNHPLHAAYHKSKWELIISIALIDYQIELTRPHKTIVIDTI